MEWIIENKEWIFSGIGVFVISFIIYKVVDKKNKSQSINQKIKTGNKSKNIQIGNISAKDPLDNE